MVAGQEERSWGALSDLPGHPMMWVLILTEVVTFGLLLLTFAAARAVQPVLFAAGQVQLDATLGGMNTVVLVTSGWLAGSVPRTPICESLTTSSPSGHPG